MNEDRQKIKVGIGIAGAAVGICLGLSHPGTGKQLADGVLALCAPFLLGIGIAFVLHPLLCRFERIYRRIGKAPRLCRPICLTLTLLAALGIAVGLGAFLLPQLGNSVRVLLSRLESSQTSLQSLLERLLQSFGIPFGLRGKIIEALTVQLEALLQSAGRITPKMIETTKDITAGIFDGLFGSVFACYLLASKEALIAGCARLIRAYLPRRYDFLRHLYHLLCHRFGGFLSGQLTEALLLGLLCFIGMKLLHMEYALLTAVLVGLTNCIPIFGPIFGAIPGMLLQALTSPGKAVWFLLFFVILQQFESNVLYPKVVGESVGLGGIGTLAAVMLGGRLFGLPGVLFGVPVFAVIAALIRESVMRRLGEKK